MCSKLDTEKTPPQYSVPNSESENKPFNFQKIINPVERAKKKNQKDEKAKVVAAVWGDRTE